MILKKNREKRSGDGTVREGDGLETGDGSLSPFHEKETKNRPLRVSDNKNIKISLKAQAHFSGFNDCKHTGKYKILYAFSAFVQ